jgi:UDP-arabinose 4-epimerase
MNNVNVLVTGGAGYIGSHTCKELAKNNFIPIVFDNLSTGHKDFVKWGPLFVGDLENNNDLKKVFKEYDPKLVIHFAAKANVAESVVYPENYFKENIYGTGNLLSHFLENNGEVFIFSSSCSVYGDRESENISENSQKNPINPYGFSKLAGEKLIEYLRAKNKFNFSILRYFNASGADSDLEIGELHHDESHVIPLIIRSILNNSLFSINGKDYPTPDGTAIRDFVHVSDLAKAHVLALKYNLNESRDIICNLGTGVGVSILELVNRFKEIEPSLTYDFKARRVGDPARLVAKIDLASKLLKWEPKYSDLFTIIQTSLAWHKKIK